MAAPASSPETLQTAFAEALNYWKKEYEEFLREKYDINTKITTVFHRCWLVGTSVAEEILSWCIKHGESAGDLSVKLEYLKDFVTDLYDALGPQDESAANKRRYGFWTHIDLNYVCLHTKKSYREHFLDRRSLKTLANMYLGRPWLHTTYFDWVFTDALIAAESVATYEWFQAQRGGVSYALFGGNKIKAGLFRFFVAVPLVFFLSWIMSGLLCWWLYGVFPRVAIIIGVLYYVVNIAWVIVYFIRLILCRLRGGKSLQHRAAELITALYNTYHELRDPTVHVPSLRRAVEQAKEKGVVWDAQLFCILDNVAQNHPSTWIIREIV
jgi:hypothetical protein